jgi:sugar phosphate isomerase/epimerase
MINPHVHVPYNRIGTYFDFINEHRINLEIFFTASYLDEIKEHEIVMLLEKLDYKPSITIHAPFMDLSPGAVDTQVREITLKRFTQVFDVTGALTPKVIVFHSGYEKWKYAHNIDMWLEGSLRTWENFLRRAADIGTKIAIENIFEDEPANLRLLMERIGSELCGICFDTGHCNLFSRVPLEEWLRQLEPYIIELHLHDNNKTFDDHLAIGDGSFDFDTLFAILKGKELVYTVEAHTPEDTITSIKRLQKYI